MGFHPFLDALSVTFATIHVPDSALDPADDIEKLVNDDSEFLRRSRIMSQLVYCTRDVLKNPDQSARKMVMDTLHRNKRSLCYRTMVGCHKTYLKDLSARIHMIKKELPVEGSSITYRILHRERKYNKNLNGELDVIDTNNDFFALYDLAAQTDVLLNRQHLFHEIKNLPAPH